MRNRERYVCNDVYRDTHRACACFVRVCWMSFIFSCDTHSSPHALGSKSVRSNISLRFSLLLCVTPTVNDPRREGGSGLVKGTLIRRVFKHIRDANERRVLMNSYSPNSVESGAKGKNRERGSRRWMEPFLGDEWNDDYTDTVGELMSATPRNVNPFNRIA